MLRAGAIVALAALAYAASAAHGAYPGRNGLIAYVESARGPGGAGWRPVIATVHADGTGARRLTAASTAAAFDPAWSPDGRRIAYVRSAVPRESGAEIWVMNADGSRKRRLTHNALFDGSPTWSPDGTRILFVRGRLDVRPAERRHADLWVMSSDGSRERQVTTTPELELEPAWSSSGRIAFLVAPAAPACSGIRCERDVWTAAADGTRRRQTGIGGDLMPSRPSWSPDGARLAVGTRLGVVVVAVNGNEARVVGTGDQPAWSPDGSLLVVAEQFRTADFVGLHVLHVGGLSRPLTRNPVPSIELLIDQTRPDWQPLR